MVIVTFLHIISPFPPSPLWQYDRDPRTIQRCQQREVLLKGFMSAIPEVVKKGTFEAGGVQQGVRVIAEAEGGNLSSVVAKAAVHGAPVNSNAGLIYNTLQSLAENRSVCACVHISML